MQNQQVFSTDENENKEHTIGCGEKLCREIEDVYVFSSELNGKKVSVAYKYIISNEGSVNFFDITKVYYDKYTLRLKNAIIDVTQDGANLYLYISVEIISNSITFGEDTKIKIY